jgi:hypothetical protein
MTMRAFHKTLKWLAISGLMITTIGNAMAAHAWYNCTVVRAGQNAEGAYEVVLKRSGVAQPKAFVIPADQTDRLMAVALTALSANLSVRAYVDWSWQDGKNINGLQAVGATQ